LANITEVIAVIYNIRSLDAGVVLVILPYTNSRHYYHLHISASERVFAERYFYSLN